MTTYLHKPTEIAKTLKLYFGVGYLDLPGRRKRHIYIIIYPEEEEVDA